MLWYDDMIYFTSYVINSYSAQLQLIWIFLWKPAMWRVEERVDSSSQTQWIQQVRQLAHSLSTNRETTILKSVTTITTENAFTSTSTTLKSKAVILAEKLSKLCTCINTRTHTCLTALFPGLPKWAGTRKVKPIWILLKQETVSGSGISWPYACLHLAPER